VVVVVVACDAVATFVDATTFSDSDIEFDVPRLVPVTVIVATPVFAVVDGAIVSVDDIPYRIDVGVNVAVVPAGSPLARSATDRRDPVLTVTVPLAPCAIDRFVGPTRSDRSLAALMRARGCRLWWWRRLACEREEE
jgi:hypothetical protein